MNFDYSSLTTYTENNLANFISTIIVIFALWLTRRLVLRYISRKFDDLETYRKWRRISVYIVYFIGAVAILTIWFQQLQFLIFFMLFIVLGLLITLKEPILNIAGWIYIKVVQPFKIGNRIQIGEFGGPRGNVVQIELFSFKLMEIGNFGNWAETDIKTGRIIDVPNGKVFTTSIANYNKMIEYIWNEINIRLSFESNWQKAQEIVIAVLNKETIKLSSSEEKKAKKQYRDFTQKYPSLEPVVYVKAVEHGLQLTLRYICAPGNIQGSSKEIWDGILKEFAKHKDISFA